MTEDVEPPEEQGNRNVENAVLLGFFVVLAAAGVWLLGSMADLRRVQDCAAQGRRNCGTIAMNRSTTRGSYIVPRRSSRIPIAS